MGGTSACRSRVDLPDLATRCQYGGTSAGRSRVDLPNLSSQTLRCAHQKGLFALHKSNKDGAYFQYNSRDLVYIISPLMRQFHTASRKVMIKYVGLVVITKVIDPHNYLLMTLDGKILRGLF